MAHTETPPVLPLSPPGADGRFARFELISWWEQERLRNAKVLVVGAGALGNEIVKNLALLGVGNLFIADLDLVEESNLSRSVLFRETDCGAAKADVASRGAREMYPGLRARGWRGDVVHDLGLGVYRWADIIVAGLDNREARVAINTHAARAGKVWVDGAIERLDGVARVFDPATGPCYECTMSDNDWRALAARRSCALLSRDEMLQGKVPTTPTTAAIIAGTQCQEVVKYLHGMETLAGRGFVFEGRFHQSYLVTYTLKPDCPAHEPLAVVRVLAQSAEELTAAELLDRARADLGEDAVLDLGRDMISGLECTPCGSVEERLGSLSSVSERDGRCARCGVMRTPRLYQTIRGDEPFLRRPLRSLGVPPWDVIAARGRDGACAYELGGDRRGVLGPLADGPLDNRSEAAR